MVALSKVFFLLGVVKDQTLPEGLTLEDLLLEGLLLQATRSNKGEYIRVGCWSLEQFDYIPSDVKESDDYIRIQQAFREMNLHSEEFEAKDEERGVYTIKII
jgi:hypothetical protein